MTTRTQEPVKHANPEALALLVARMAWFFAQQQAASMAQEDSGNSPVQTADHVSSLSSVTE